MSTEDRCPQIEMQLTRLGVNGAMAMRHTVQHEVCCETAQSPLCLSWVRTDEHLRILK
jgi:hypothetical protein